MIGAEGVGMGLGQVLCGEGVGTGVLGGQV